MATLNFDATQVEPSNSYELLPVGEYVAIIEESEVKQTSNGNGQYLSLKFQIIDGNFKGRVLFSNLNIQNDNAKAQQIGLGQLSAICRAVGKLNIQDSCELHNLPLKIKVGVRFSDYKQENENVIKSYSSASVAQTQAPQTTQWGTQATPQAQGLPEPPPWIKG